MSLDADCVIIFLDADSAIIYLDADFADYAVFF